MDDWCPFATKRPLTYHNYWDGRSGQPIKAVCIHIAAGPMSAIYPTFNVPNGSSSHFAVSKTGLIEQYVSVNDTAWTCGLAWTGSGWQNPRGVPVKPTWSLITAGVNPNLNTINIEHEGFPSDSWTQAMLDADVKLLRWVGMNYKVGETLIGHNMIDPVDRPNDPGIDLNIIINALNTGTLVLDGQVLSKDIYDWLKLTMRLFKIS